METGLSSTQVDNRIQARVADWAQAGNNTVVPSFKLPDGTHIIDELIRVFKSNPEKGAEFKRSFVQDIGGVNMNPPEDK